MDILIEKNLYPALTKIPIKSSFLITIGNPALVVAPTIDGLLGDKLTAFAPSTTGVPYIKRGKSLSMEIMKQVFDIGHLFDKAENLEIVKQSFNSIALMELHYRNQSIMTIEDVHNDVFQTSLTVASRGTMGEGNFKAIQEGIQRVARFIFSESFQLDKAITASAKAVYLSAALRSGQLRIDKYRGAESIRELLINDPFLNRLNKLKKSNPEAFFYWHSTIGLHEVRKKTIL